VGLSGSNGSWLAHGLNTLQLGSGLAQCLYQACDCLIPTFTRHCFEDTFYLKCGNIEIRCSDVDEIVLNHVDKRWNRDTHAVPWLLDNILIQMGTTSADRHAFLQPDYDEASRDLEHFCHNDGCRRRKHVPGTRSDVAHDNNERSIL